MTTPLHGFAPYAHAPDVESRHWLETLGATGPEREEAVERLHELLLRAARFEVGRRLRSGCCGGFEDELEDLTAQAADDALVAILATLDSYRGDSRFTTWAYKFALKETAVKIRRRPWQGREVPPESDGLEAAVGEALSVALAEELSAEQRAVLVATALNDVPIDVLAERRDTTRDALYKTLHDARRKLRSGVVGKGLA